MLSCFLLLGCLRVEQVSLDAHDLLNVSQHLRALLLRTCCGGQSTRVLITLDTYRVYYMYVVVTVPTNRVLLYVHVHVHVWRIAKYHVPLVLQ